ncbi:MAG: FIST C-terminal domain-containing protein [Lachnospiraceae bacterium]
MFSCTAITKEIDEIDIAIRELKEQIPFNKLKSNTAGIMYFYYDVNYEELCQRVKEEFDFPIIGVSAMGMFENSGYDEYLIELLVMSGDDVAFSAGMTGALTKDNVEDEICQTYRNMASMLPDKEKIIFTFSSHIPQHASDNYVNILTRLCGDVPIYGGLVSDMMTFSDYRVFYDGKTEHFAAAFLMISGNVKPKFFLEYSISDVEEIKEPVTKVDGNRILTMGDKSFRSTIASMGMSSTNEFVVLEFSQSPFMMEMEAKPGKKVRVLRNLSYLYSDDSGAFLGDIPENSKLYVTSMQVGDIGVSVRRAIRNLLNTLNDSVDYEYSTIVCTSCMARYMNLLGDKSIEADAYKNIIPKNMNVAGFYSFGEFCPVHCLDKDDETYYNVFHNCTFTMVAL